jgi:hypothetical protein
MKISPIVLVLALLAAWPAAAQMAVQVVTDQNEFLPSEAVALGVKITNRSGQQLHLGADAGWLTFIVEAVGGDSVFNSSEVPVVGEFDLESSQMATKVVDIAPYFALNKPGRYKVTALVHMKDWGQTISSAPKVIDIVTGVKLWSQDFGVPATNGAPEMRRFTLEEANNLHEQLRLYVQLSDTSEARVFKVMSLGPMVAFGQPEEQVDRFSQLHVLWQTGGQTFRYSIVAPDGTMVKRDAYDYYPTRPKLRVNADGDVEVAGGTRRTPPSEMPAAAAPVALPTIVSPTDVPTNLPPVVPVK